MVRPSKADEFSTALETPDLVLHVTWRDVTRYSIWRVECLDLLLHHHDVISFNTVRTEIFPSVIGEGIKGQPGLM